MKVAINVKPWWNGSQVNSGTEAAEEQSRFPLRLDQHHRGTGRPSAAAGHHRQLDGAPFHLDSRNDSHPVNVERSGEARVAFIVPELSKGANPGFVKTSEGPVELTVDHPVPVWAYIAGRGVENKSGASIDATIAHSEWALVVTMTLEKGK